MRRPGKGFRLRASHAGDYAMRYGRLLNVATMLLLVLRVTGVTAQTPAGPARPAAFHLMEATVDEVRGALQSGHTTCRGLVELYLKRIDAYDKAGPGLNAVQTINPRARQEADRLDSAFKSSGAVGPLHCIPVLLKDQVDTRDMPTTTRK
jgi:amidase